MKNPLDEELIKTKGQLKIPLRGDGKDSSKRESREIADAIAEIEEERQAKEDRIRKESAMDMKKKETGEKTGNEVKGEKLSESAGTDEKRRVENLGVVDKPNESNGIEQRQLNLLEAKIADTSENAIDKESADKCTDEGKDTENFAIKKTIKTERQRIEKGKSGVGPRERVENEVKSNDTLLYKDIEAEASASPDVTELDLIQNTGILVPDVKVELDEADQSSVNLASTASEYSAEFTFKSDFTDRNACSETKKDNVSSKVVQIKSSKRENVNECELQSKRLSASISELDFDSKQEDEDSNEFNIQEIFGAKQLKHVERPPESGQGQGQTVSRSNGVDNSASDDDEVYIAKSLPELAQVFEPGDLKPKRHSRRQDGSKSPKPGGSEQRDSS